MSEIEIACEYVKPKGMLIKQDNVEFWVGGRFATFYRWAVAHNLRDEFMRESREYWIQSYNRAVQAKEELEEKKRQRHESYLEHLRIKQNAKKYARRHPEKSGITTPDNAAQTPEQGNQLLGELYHGS